MLINLAYKILNFLRRTIQRHLHFTSLGVKAFIMNDKREVLMVEHTYMPGWHLPGGGVLPNETPADAVIREVREETGVIIHSKPELFAIYLNDISGASDYPVLYIIKAFTIDPNPLPSGEIRAVGWFSVDALPADTPMHTQLRIKEALEGIPPSPNWSD